MLAKSIFRNQTHLLRRTFSSMLSANAKTIPSFDYTPPKYTGPSLEEMKAKRGKFVSPASFMFYRNPLMIVDGKM